MKQEYEHTFNHTTREGHLTGKHRDIKRKVIERLKRIKMPKEEPMNQVNKSSMK